jgi:hypothetical protein
MRTRYHVTPLHRDALTPAHWFDCRRRALTWARRIADRWRTSLAVWEVHGRRLRLVRRVEPEHTQP